MLRVGPNPYGLTYTLGIQGQSPAPRDALWFTNLAEQMGAASIEFHYHHVAALSDAQIEQLKGRLTRAEIQPVISGPWPIDCLAQGFDLATRLGVKVIRTHLSPVLSGDRADNAFDWNEIVKKIRTEMPLLGRKFADAGLTLAIEDHQDFGSWDLLEFAELGGASVGICFDTGNPLAVAEDPIAFAHRVADKVRHVHLKDYRAHFTAEGYRLVRCPIGDGAVPLAEIAEILNARQPGLTATLEPGAHFARHIRLRSPDWWNGYDLNAGLEVDTCLQTAMRNCLPESDDWQTPVERGEPDAAVCQYERLQMKRSVENMKKLGWLPK